MTEETYVKAKQLKKSINIIKTAWKIMCHPYPEINLAYESDNLKIDFVSLDENTRDELKKAIQDVLDKRYDELIKEFESL